MKYFVDSNKIEEFINNCNDCIKEMDNQSKIMKELPNKLTWRGNAHDAAILKYNKIMDDLEKIPEDLTLYTKFMELVVKNYGEGTEKLKKEFQEILQRLEIERVSNEL